MFNIVYVTNKDVIFLDFFVITWKTTELSFFIVVMAHLLKSTPAFSSESKTGKDLNAFFPQYFIQIVFMYCIQTLFFLQSDYSVQLPAITKQESVCVYIKTGS